MDPNTITPTFSDDWGYKTLEQMVAEEELIAPPNTPVLDFEFIDLETLADALRDCAVCKKQELSAAHARACS